jgi:hypothetical protein
MSRMLKSEAQSLESWSISIPSSNLGCLPLERVRERREPGGGGGGV